METMDGYDGPLTDLQLRDREIQVDMGVKYQELARTAPWRRRLLGLLYHPFTELFIFSLILISIGLLVIEITTSDSASGGWMGLLMGRAQGAFFWADVFITVCFVVEYALKLLVAPRKGYFIWKNVLDLLALLPIMRIFRLGRAVRLFRLLRMLRVVRIGSVLEQQFDRVNAESQRFRLENTVIAVYLVFSLIFGTVGIMVFEKGVNDQFNTLGDGLWWCVVTLTTVGYGDYYPISPGGKFVAAIIMFIGLSFYALLTSTISTILIERARNNQGQEMEIAALEHHVVVCGWNDHAYQLLQDLVRRAPPPHIVVLVEGDDVPRVQHTHIFYLFHDPSSAHGLAAARVRHADVVVVLADPRWGDCAQDIDARTILTVLAVERLRPEVHTIAELLNPANVFHARNASVDEILLAGQHTGSMLSQAVQTPYITDVFAQLFTPGAGSSFVEQPLPAALYNRSFRDVSQRLLAENGRILVGFRRANQLRLAPEEDLPLIPGDQMILLRSIDRP